jgi:Transglutaminase-like superfamily
MRSVLRIGPSGWLLVTRLLLWRLTLPALRRALNTERLVRLLAAPRAFPRDPRREGLVLAVTGRLWRRSQGTCLERSLAAYRALGRIGASPRFVLAATHDKGSIVGHAWVEVDGRAVLEATDPRTRYTPLVEFDAAGRRVLATQP